MARPTAIPSYKTKVLSTRPPNCKDAQKSPSHALLHQCHVISYTRNARQSSACSPPSANAPAKRVGHWTTVHQFFSPSSLSSLFTFFIPDAFYVTYYLVYFLTYLSTSFTIDPFRFQARGRRRRPHMALVFWVNFL